MSLVTVCYRAILKSARYHGWYYPCGIHVHKDADDVDVDTYLWKHIDDEYETFPYLGSITKLFFEVIFIVYYILLSAI